MATGITCPSCGHTPLDLYKANLRIAIKEYDDAICKRRTKRLDARKRASNSSTMG